jgi:hypothetical protein
MEMPRYVCHKQVWALKIKAIGVSSFIPEDSRYAEIPLSQDYMVKHKPQAGGYYVVYQDGYESYSPAKAFEEGYSLIE